jgi:hypothetical protein
MSEFRSKWLNYPETSQNPPDRTDKRAFVGSVGSPNKRVGLKNSKNSRKSGSKTSENLCHVAPLDLPFPLGYKGLPVRSVRAALAWCDAKEITDPIEVMWTVCVWVLDHFKMVKYLGPLYQKVRERERELWTDLTGSDDDPYCDECPGIQNG